MIKINKDLDNIPESLNSNLTNQRRNELIESGRYIREDVYHSRYKMPDIKEFLEAIYHKKCAYCEKAIDDSNVPIEHYRPKSIYYWLAYSWDNLLLCCDRCNTYKGKKFEIASEKALFNRETLNDIHKLSLKYNEIEQPKMIHPEFEDVENKLIFENNGRVTSEDERVRYTIETCRIDRELANERRKKILDDFINKYKDRLYHYQITKDIQILGAIKWLIDDFRKDSVNPDNDYLAFRRWIIRNIKFLINSGDN